MKTVECHLHALMCSVTVVFIHTMEDDQRLNTLVHEGDTLNFASALHKDSAKCSSYCCTAAHGYLSIIVCCCSDNTVYHSKGNTDLPIVDWNPPDIDESWEDDGM